VAERFSSELSPLLLPDAEDIGDLAARMLRWRRDLTGWERRIEPTMRSLRAYTWDDMAEQIVRTVEGPEIDSAAAPGSQLIRRDRLRSRRCKTAAKRR
jgi:hypothetical protein